ncbi:MAG: hypothetical protein IJ542_03350 [Clostridia bacterium]|nr:hypothetical protein [Clostridia bacterium]
MANRIEEMIEAALAKVKQTIDSSTVVGNPIEIDGKIVVPVTKVTLGLVSGGGEYSTTDKQIKKTETYPIAGGTGTGISIQPVGFLCQQNNKFEFLKVDALSPMEKIFETLPKLTEAVVEVLKEKKK